MLNIQSRIDQAQLIARIWARQSTRDFIARYPDATSVNVFSGLKNNQIWVRSVGYISQPTVKVEVRITAYECDIDITDFATEADSEGLSAEIIMEDRVIRGVRHLAVLAISSRYTGEQRQLLECLGKLHEQFQPGYSYKTLSC